MLLLAPEPVHGWQSFCRPSTLCGARHCCGLEGALANRLDLSAPHYQSTVTPVILSRFLSCRILVSPTTEPGRRGWKRRLGSPISAPHFLPRHSPGSAICTVRR